MKKNKLTEIVAEKRQEIKIHKSRLSLEFLKNYAKKPKHKIRSIHAALAKNKGMAIFAEIKRKSPAEPAINSTLDIPKTLGIYEKNRVTAISILTDYHFGGSLDFLKIAKAGKNPPTKRTPILRKDFIVDEYQIFESLYYGADMILLIASLLGKQRLALFIKTAHAIGLECLVEIHDESEIKKVIAAGASIVGINARNLKTFNIDLDNIVRLAPKIPSGPFIVAESGIRDGKHVAMLSRAGVKGVLVGTALMRATNIGAKIKEFRNMR